MSVRVGIVGAAGRMGRLLQEVLPEFPRFHSGALVVSPSSRFLGQSAIGGGVYQADLEAVIASVDCVLDFSVPTQSVRSAEICALHKRPLLIGVSGHTSEEREHVERAARQAPIALLANTSFGMSVMHEVVALAARLLGSGVDIEICEAHHRGKRDAPSGTALSLARRLAGEREGARPVLRGAAERAAGEIGMVALRGGDTPGEHAVYFFGEGERIEVHHRVRDRAVFARGAFRLLDRLVDQPPGIYRASDLIGYST